MSDSKFFMFPDNFGGNGSGGNQSIDPLLAMLLNNNGGFGANGNWIWIFFLFLIWGRNGWGNGFGNNGCEGIGNMASNETARELFMQGINGNRAALEQLSTVIGCKFDDVNSALCAISSKIEGVANQVGMTGQQVINAVNAGNADLGYRLANCCCEIKTQMLAGFNDVQRDISILNGNMIKGFSDVGYAFRDQTCSLEKAIESSTSRILEGQRAAEMRDMQDKLDAAREKVSQQAVIINNAQQTATFGQMINQATTPIYQAVGALQNDINGIKCKLPETVTLPYSCATAVPTQALINPFSLANLTARNWGCGCENTLWG
jgi:hypothetical protein